MELEFYRINQTLKHVIEYYDISFIKEHFLMLSGKEQVWSTPHRLDVNLDLIFILFKRMDEEIQQVIHTCNKNTQVYVFEKLREWLTDYRIENVNEIYISNLIEDYNAKTNLQFHLKVESDTEKFIHSLEYNNRKHLEEYEENAMYFPSFAGIVHPSKNRIKKTFYKYYIVEEVPDLIDTDFLPQYLKIIEAVINGFKQVVCKYVDLWDQGKITTPGETIILKEYSKIIESTKDPESKLQFNLSVPQLAYLFRLLYDFALLGDSNKEALYIFVNANFLTKETKEKISIGSFRNNYNNTLKATAEFWAANLKRMLERAKNE